MLTFEQIKELIDLVRDRRLAGLEIERAGFRLKIDGPAAAAARDGDAPVAVELAETIAEEAAVGPASEPTPAAAEVALATAEPVAGQESPHVLKSPIVGTFYAAPSPEANPYVEVGDRVKRGQVLCIVEAMKLMNEIESDVDGEILEIYPRNAQPVEFGEALFAIRSR